MKFKLLCLIILSFSSLASDSYRIEVKKTLDSNAHESYMPNLILPMSWNKNLSSSLEYRSGETTDERKFINIDDSIINEEIKHKRLKLNALNYSLLDERSSYSFGLGGSYEVYDKLQSGFFVDNLGYRSNYNSSLDISILSLYFKAEYLYRTSYLDIKLYGIIVPLSSLDVAQNIAFSGTIVKDLSASSSNTQDINYEVDLEFISNLDTFIDFGINAKYRFLPLKYSLDSGSGAIDTSKEENITLLSARVLFNVEVLNGWLPTIGYSNEVTNSKDTSDGSVRVLEENIVYIGLNTRF